MAAALLSERLRRHGLGAVVESAGLRALVGRPAELHAQALMRERGLDLSAHRARQLTPEVITPFELVLVMEASQERAVHALLPSARGRVHRIGRFGGFEVPDPYGQDRRAFERSLALIDRGLADFEEAFWGGRA
jgi:protein-tyrosine phosphatase